MLIVILTQLSVSVGWDNRGYPDDALLKTLWEHARKHPKAEGAFGWAITRALDHLDAR